MEIFSKYIYRCKISVMELFSRKGGTSSFRTRLQCKHPEKYKELNKNEKEKSSPINQKAEVASTSSSASLGSEEKTRQQTIIKSFGKMKKWDKNDSKSKSMDNKIAEMIVLDDLPFTHVEDFGFQRLMEESSPQFVLKQTRFYRNLVCEEMYSSVASKLESTVSSQIKTCNGLLIIDEWSDSTSGVSPLFLTYHAIYKNFQRKHFVLNAEPLSERHTGDYLETVFEKMLTKWKISLNEVYCVVRDSGTNIKKALSLAVKNSILSQKCISDLITKCRLIATHFNHSVVEKNELKKIHSRLNVRPLSVLQDIQTQWNSSLHVLKRMSEINKAICIYALSSTEIKPLTADENDILNNYTNVLNFLKNEQRLLVQLNPVCQM